MIHVDVEQGTERWERMRIGRPTASQFDRILTPARLNLSTSAPKYMAEILAEWLLDRPLDFSGASAAMEYGTDNEDKARALYELRRDVEVEPGGFVMTDDEKVGGSPDGLVGDDGGLEIKCPLLHTHVRYLMDPDELVTEYRGQVQGYLWLTGRAWWDIVSHSPVLPTVIERIEPDPEYHAALAKALAAFLEDLDAAKERLAEHRQEYVPPTVEAVQAAGAA